MGLYIDDILLSTNDIGLIHETMKFDSKHFEMKDIREAPYVIGIETIHDRSQELLQLSHKEYAIKVLKKFECNI